MNDTLVPQFRGHYATRDDDHVDPRMAGERKPRSYRQPATSLNGIYGLTDREDFEWGTGSRIPLHLDAGGDRKHLKRPGQVQDFDFVEDKNTNIRRHRPFGTTLGEFIQRIDSMRVSKDYTTSQLDMRQFSIPMRPLPACRRRWLPCLSLFHCFRVVYQVRRG